ncbi:MAG: N-acetylmuramoyl-L-alanine amidase, partial [Lachnospiraceae bacterium]|nr:N-acetylmuramoyl-L-alanine amidase [Lachnospiraceae bacterium]
MYKAFFDREPDAAGKEYWIGKLKDKATRGFIFDGFTGSVEFRRLCKKYGIITGTEKYASIDYKQTEGCSICGVKEGKGVKVAIDPGHTGNHARMTEREPNGPGSPIMGYRDAAGATGAFTGIPEYQLTMDISLMLKAELESRGYEVFLTREDNNAVISCMERALAWNASGADFAIRIHADSIDNPSPHGACMLTSSKNNQWIGHLYQDSHDLAEMVLRNYCETAGFYNRGFFEYDTLNGNNWSTIPVCLIEMGFMTNYSDDTRMADPEVRKLMVKGMADGIDEYVESRK